MGNCTKLPTPDEFRDMMKNVPALPFSSGTEYEIFKYNFCERCKCHKVREDGFPDFPDNGGCVVEDAMEYARLDISLFPNKKIRKIINSDGDVVQWHRCMDFIEKED